MDKTQRLAYQYSTQVPLSSMSVLDSAPALLVLPHYWCVELESNDYKHITQPLGPSGIWTRVKWWGDDSDDLSCSTCKSIRKCMYIISSYLTYRPYTKVWSSDRSGNAYCVSLRSHKGLAYALQMLSVSFERHIILRSLYVDMQYAIVWYPYSTQVTYPGLW
jgi:hypothetical protein